MIVKESNPRGEACSFDTDTHLYWGGTETDKTSIILNELIPVTKLIAQFYTVSPWRGEKTDIAFGNRVHAVAADCLRQQSVSVSAQSDDERAAFSTTWQFARRLRDNNRIADVERTIFSLQAGVAGTVDLMFVCNERVFVCDWKTGDLMLPAKCKFNAPFGHLVADPLTIYALQLSMYKVLLDAGCYFGNATFAPTRLLWLHKADSAWKVDAVTCRDLRREASEMMLMRGYTPWFIDWQKRCPF